MRLKESTLFYGTLERQINLGIIPEDSTKNLEKALVLFALRLNAVLHSTCTVQKIMKNDPDLCRTFFNLNLCESEFGDLTLDDILEKGDKVLD